MSASLAKTAVAPALLQDGKQLRVEFGGSSSAGGKSSNEDALAAHQPTGSALQLKGATLCIADGASCSENAQLASQTSVTHFISDYYSTPDAWPVKTAAARVLSALNAWLFHHGRQSVVPHNGLVTTFSAAVLKSTTAHLFHVGDSRIWRYRNGDLEQLTRDHSHHQAGGVFLIRALGMDNRLEVDYLTEELQVGDLLVFTTDGVHGPLGRAGLAAALAQALPADSLEHAAQQVVEAALARDNGDNATCLLARVAELPLENIDEIHRKLTKLAIPPVLQAGQTIDGYRVLRVLHSGTRSHLYLVEADQKRYALKAPSENFAEDPQYLEGFIREQWVGRRIDHAGVMKVHPRPDDSPFLYLLCEYIEGQTLRQWMFDHPRPDLAEARRLLADIAGALRAFQRLHMTHRDLKPENIMLCADGRLKIIDFGTVQVGGLEELSGPGRTEIPVGSVNYSAPEYLQGGRGGHVSDIFSVGVIAYELLTGKLPYDLPEHRQQDRNPRDYRYISARIPRADLPGWFDLALQKATHPYPQQRYEALSEFLQDLNVPNQALVDKHRSAPLLERNPLLFWRALALVLAVVVMVQWALLSA